MHSTECPSSSVYLSIFVSSCPETDISATVTPIGVKCCKMVHIGPGHKASSPLLAAVPQWGTKSQILSANNSKIVSRSVVCQLKHKISSTSSWWKCIAWDSTPTGEFPIRKNVFFARGQISRADQRENLHDGRALSRRWVSPLLVAISLGVSK